MIALPPNLLGMLGFELWHWFTVFLRVSAFVALLPAFGERSIPARVKLGAALAFTLIIATAVQGTSVDSDLATLLGLVGTEVVIGLAMGIAVRLFVLALQTAGSIAAQSTSLSQILGGAAVEPVPAMGYLLMIAGIALACLMGIHVRAAELLIRTYDMLPIGTQLGAATLAEWGVGQVSQAFSLAFSLAVPFVIASLVYNLALGVINRAMPQLMVAFVGAPAITLAGLFFLFAGAPLILSVWSDALFGFLANPFGKLP